MKNFLTLLIIATIMIQCKLRGLNRLILARVGSPHYAVDATDLSSDNIPQPSTIILLLVRAFLGPRGPLRTPSSVCPFVRSSVRPRQKSESPLEPYKSSQDHAGPLL